MIVSYPTAANFHTHIDAVNVLAHVLMDQFTLPQAIPYCFQSGLRQLTQSSEHIICETWGSQNPVQYGKSDNVVCAHDLVALLGYVELDTSLPLDAMTEQAYTAVFAAAERAGFPELIRMWHYLPRLNEYEQGVSRYQLFCRGRNRVLGVEQNVGMLEKRCATTVIGTDAREHFMFFIATRNKGIAIENEQQTNPWEYPQMDASERPLFSRATWSPDLSMLFISGTASIVGSESKHTDSAVAQVQQIFENLDELLARCAETTGKRITDFSCLKVYTQATTETEVIHEAIKTCLSVRQMHAKTILKFWGEICRKELAVEIDALCVV